MVSEGFIASAMVASTYMHQIVLQIEHKHVIKYFPVHKAVLVFKRVCLCGIALQILPHQTWIRWNFLSCVMVCAGTCRIFPSPSSPLQYMLRWSTLPKVRADDLTQKQWSLLYCTVKQKCWRDVPCYWTFSTLNRKKHMTLSVPFVPLKKTFIFDFMCLFHCNH